MSFIPAISVDNNVFVFSQTSQRRGSFAAGPRATARRGEPASTRVCREGATLNETALPRAMDFLFASGLGKGLRAAPLPPC